MNLGQLEEDLFRRLGFVNATVDPVVRARFRAYMNQVQREILGQKGLTPLRRATLPFESVAGSTAAVLPQAAVRVISVADRARQLYLTPLSLESVRELDPGMAATSATPYGYVVANLSEGSIFNQLVPGELFAKSDSAVDGATKMVFVEGVITGGYPRLASVALNGITAVSLGATITTWTRVNKFYVATTTPGVQTVAAGNITLTTVSGLGLEIARIPIGKAYARYTRLTLFPMPSAVVTYHADVELHIEDMAQATDEAYLPEDFAWLLTSGALLKEYQRLEKSDLYAAERAVYRDGLGNLKLFVARAGDEVDPHARWRRWSQLGSYFPAGS